METEKQIDQQIDKKEKERVRARIIQRQIEKQRVGVNKSINKKERKKLTERVQKHADTKRQSDRRIIEIKELGSMRDRTTNRPKDRLNKQTNRQKRGEVALIK
jgi:hypothetical protein